MVKRIVLWLLVAANMAVIFMFSSQPAAESSATSESFAYKVLSIISPSFRDMPEEKQIERVESVQNIFRKGAHFSIYALLGFLICLLITVGYSFGRGFIFSPVFAGLYAVSDELHQHFVEGRTGKLGDVVIDFFGAVCGALLAAAITALIAKMRSRVKQN